MGAAVTAGPANWSATWSRATMAVMVASSIMLGFAAKHHWRDHIDAADQIHRKKTA